LHFSSDEISGLVASTNGYIGYNGNNNNVLVSGAASIWSNAYLLGNFFSFPPKGELIVGYSGLSNSMTIADGGQVLSTDSAIGGSDNAVTVFGSGSSWNISRGLTIGASGSGNSLTVTNGGQVIAGRGVGVGSSNWLYASNAAYIASVGLQIGDGGRVSLQSNTIWNLGRGTLSLGSDAGSDLSIDASSSVTNIAGLTLRGNNNTFYMTNSAAGVVFNEFTTNQLQFHGGRIELVVGGSGAALIVSNYVLNSGQQTQPGIFLPLFGPLIPNPA
jgi:T5SS/PEP-CTERM-associated repeat protein